MLKLPIFILFFSKYPPPGRTLIPDHYKKTYSQWAEEVNTWDKIVGLTLQLNIGGLKDKVIPLMMKKILMTIVMMIMIIIMMTGHPTDVRHALGSLGRGPGEGVEGLERLEETRR